jgi:hypothetical protein
VLETTVIQTVGLPVHNKMVVSAQTRADCDSDYDPDSDTDPEGSNDCRDLGIGIGIAIAIGFCSARYLSVCKSQSRGRKAASFSFERTTKQSLLGLCVQVQYS